MITLKKQVKLVFENETFEHCLEDLDFQMNYYVVQSHTITKVDDAWFLVIIGYDKE